MAARRQAALEGACTQFYGPGLGSRALKFSGWKDALGTLWRLLTVLNASSEDSHPWDGNAVPSIPHEHLDCPSGAICTMAVSVFAW